MCGPRSTAPTAWRGRKENRENDESDEDDEGDDANGTGDKDTQVIRAGSGADKVVITIATPREQRARNGHRRQATPKEAEGSVSDADERTAAGARASGSSVETLPPAVGATFATRSRDARASGSSTRSATARPSTTHAVDGRRIVDGRLNLRIRRESGSVGDDGESITENTAKSNWEYPLSLEDRAALARREKTAEQRAALAGLYSQSDDKAES